MGSELNIAVTDQELAYRSKNFSDWRGAEKRELFCSSCGNILSHNSKHVYSHPIFGLLQCENCNNYFKTVTFSLDKDDSVRYCHICGRERSSSYGCSKSNCPYEFCKPCIKRNVPQSLVDAESGKWKCFACNSKPLWKLRGACAAVMSSLPKRTGSKKVKSRESSSERENDVSDLKNRSFVKRTQLEKSQKLNNKLQSFCDEESPIQQEEQLTNPFFSSHKKSSNNKNVKKKSVEKLSKIKASGRAANVVSSDESEVEEIVSRKREKNGKTKSQRENSTERTKAQEQKRKFEDCSRDRKNHKSENSKRAARGSLILEDASIQNPQNSSDEFEITPKIAKRTAKKVSDTKEKMPSTSKKLSSKGAFKDRGKTSRPVLRDINENESSESSSDDSGTSELKRLMPTAFAKKPKNDENSAGSSRKKENEEESSKKKKPPVSKSKTSSIIKSSKTTSRSTKQQLRRSESTEPDGNSRPVSRSVPADSSENSSDESVTTNTKRESSTAISKKRKNSSHNKNTSSRRNESSDDEESTQKKPSSSKSAKSSTNKTSDIPANARTRQSIRSKSMEPSDRRNSLPVVKNVSVILKDIAKVVEKNSCKTFNHLRLSRQESDSSSGKEFRSTKISRKSHMTLRKIEDLERDCTSVPDGLREDDEEIPKSQSFALKNSVHSYLSDLRLAAMKVINEIDELDSTYCAKGKMRASMRPVEAANLIVKTKNISSMWESNDRVFQAKTKVVDYYDEWCKKTRQKNHWKIPKNTDESEKPSSELTKKRISRTSEDSESDTKSVTKVPSATRKVQKRSKSPEGSIASGEKSVVVSDCDSNDIFSDNETRMSISRSNAASPKKSTISKSKNSESPTESKKSKARKLSSSSVEDEAAAKKVNDTDESSTKVSENPERIESPTMSQFSGRSDKEDDAPMENTNNPSEKSPIPSEDLNGSRDAANKSPDLFETSVESNNDRPSDDESTVTKPYKNEEVERAKKKNSQKTSQKEPESKATMCDKDSDSDRSKKVSSRPASIVANDSDDSSEKSKKKTTRRSSNAAQDSEDSGNEKSKKKTSRRSSNAAHESEDSDNEKSKKNTSRSPSIVVSASENSSDEKSKRISSAAKESENSGDEISKNDKASESNDKIKENLSDADTEEYVVPSENVESVNVSDEDIASAETVVVDSNRRSSGADSIVNCDIASMATELYGSSPGGQSNLPMDENESSPCNDDEKKEEATSDKEGRTSKKSKEIKKRKKANSESRSDSPRRLSPNMETPESIKNSSRNGSRASSDTTDSASNALALRSMLISSNSDDSSEEHQSRTERLNTKSSNEAPPTPPESYSKSEKSSRKGSTEGESEVEEKTNETDKRKKKKSKFRVDQNRYYLEDEKLKLKCKIPVERLEENILKRHSRALKKSREYVEAKEIKRVLALNRLDKNKKRIDSSSEDEDNPKLKRGARKSRAKEREETLMDHLKKGENGENIVSSSASEDDSSTSGKKNKPEDKSIDSIFEKANKMEEKRMLENSDSSAAEEEEPASDEKAEESVKKSKKTSKKEKAQKSSEDEQEKKKKSDKGRWRKNKILTLKISDSDSEEESKKYKLSLEKQAEKKKSQGSDSESEESSPVKKKRVRRRVLHSDSDAEVSPITVSDSDSSIQSIKMKKKKKKKNDSSDEEVEEKKKSRKRTRRGRNSSDSSSTEEKRPKPTRRKRIKIAGSDSDSEDEELTNSQSSPGKSGRKNIRKVLRDKQVAEDTKQAAKDEEERLKRIAERQKLYNEMYEVRLAGEEKVEKLVLDFDEETKEPLVSVHEDLVKRLKPHQAQGIKFMWDACFESLERTKSTKGSGCILAHCMGLGKSFQIVTLAHTLLTHEETGIKTVLVVCPLSTVLNWVNEFKIWLSNMPSELEIETYELTKMKKHFERKYKLEEWQRNGGVMIIGYEMFRNLSNIGTKKVRKNIQESYIRSLVDPGPDLIVCDEGHLLKKEDTALSKAMRRIKTLRRIVLTGTPLQNNLIEYHCMVQFVKPNLLGTKREFMNRFENPITNGQFDDSTEYDVKLMKKRAHVLHKMLEGSVQRFDYSVLTPFLPPKQEYVIFVRLSEVQIKMYQHYLDNYARRHQGVGSSLFADFQALQRIWTHPMVVKMNAEKVEQANEKKRHDETDSEGSLRDFIDDGSDSTSSSGDNSVQSASGSDSKKPKCGTRANPVAEEPIPAPEVVEEINDETSWWTQFVENDEVYEDLRISSKLVILFRILKECEQLGDKVLVFSQSLYSLTLIEKFLGMIDEETQKGNERETLDGHTGSWAPGLDYFRLDGQSSTDNRRMWCNVFNRPSNTRARLFLISTRAGGLGINLTAANRVIIFDASWNPSHDVQSIFRIFRFGQKKPCYVYRLLAAGTMEEKIYNRQVTKLSLSCRVVDEQQIERHYSNNALAELYKLELPSQEESTLNLPKDRLLAEIFSKCRHYVETYHEHDSLLENQAGEELDEEERQQAWLEYEEEKKGKRMMPPMPFMDYQEQLRMQQMNMMVQNPLANHQAMMADLQNIQRMMQKDYPGVTEEQQKIMASKAVFEMYNYVEKHAVAGHSSLPMMNVPNVQTGQFGMNTHIRGPAPVIGHPTADILRSYQQSLAQARNGQINNYQNNQGHLGLQRQGAIGQFGQFAGVPTTSTVDDDIMEIPASPDRSVTVSASVSDGSRKRKEE